MTGRILFFVACALLFLLFWIPVLGGLNAFRRKKPTPPENKTAAENAPSDKANAVPEATAPAAGEVKNAEDTEKQ